MEPEKKQQFKTEEITQTKSGQQVDYFQNAQQNVKLSLKKRVQQFFKKIFGTSRNRVISIAIIALVACGIAVLIAIPVATNQAAINKINEDNSIQSQGGSVTGSDADDANEYIGNAQESAQATRDNYTQEYKKQQSGDCQGNNCSTMTSYSDYVIKTTDALINTYQSFIDSATQNSTKVELYFARIDDVSRFYSSSLDEAVKVKIRNQVISDCRAAIQLDQGAGVAAGAQNKANFVEAFDAANEFWQIAIDRGISSEGGN